MKRARAIVLSLFVLAGLAAFALGERRVVAQPGAERSLELELPRVALRELSFTVGVKLRGSGWPERGRVLVEGPGGATLYDQEHALTEELSLSGVRAPASSGAIVVRVVGQAEARGSLDVIAAWLSILPPLFAIVLAIVVREVIVALVAGVWLGATFTHGFDPLAGLLRAADTYAVGALADRDHASIAIFSLLLGGMIGVIAKSGGALGMAEVVTKLAKDRLRGALATWLMGLAIFFDDYSNALLVGTTMRPITDRLKISREKLSFLVDATSAPVSSFALVSSWVGVEVGYIADQYAAVGLAGDPYLVFLETIPYRFYPILMLVFGLYVILMRRDFGPMHAAEQRALRGEGLVRPGSKPASDFDAHELTPPEGRPPRWAHAVIPIAVVIVTAVIGMYVTGSEALDAARASAEEALEAAREGGDASALAAAERALAQLEPSLRNVFGKASSLNALLWAALLGGLAAIVTALATRTLRLRDAMESWVHGVRSIALAVMILVLAWSLGEVCAHLHTARFIISAIGEHLPPAALSGAVFVVAAVVSFATGTSWGTMGILFPLVVPLAHALAPDEPTIVLGSVASILSGSVWGDHCSPISDTTIMSSMASSCDHVDHVRTQLPYALAVGGVSLVAGELAMGLGLYGPWVALLVGAVMLFLLVRFLGKPLAG
ncbi:MAG: hypothetical protein KF729_24480 [Sandaracinaceae bacterium]|nr:hypothetical protein [Sandaracinaceae bacterium]